MWHLADLLCGFCLERFPLPLGACDGLRYFIVALPEYSGVASSEKEEISMNQRERKREERKSTAKDNHQSR